MRSEQRFFVTSLVFLRFAAAVIFLSGGGAGAAERTLIDEATFKIKEVAKAKTGDVAGPERKWPGIFTTVEASVVKSDETFEMKFYLLVFETGSRLYLMQASTTLPVREARERQVYELIRSLVAKE